jgi:hypothetical protein
MSQMGILVPNYRTEGWEKNQSSAQAMALLFSVLETLA